MIKLRSVIYVIVILIILLLVFYVWLVYEAKAPPKNLTKIQVYFGNKLSDPEALDCSKVFLVERWIAKQPSVTDLAKLTIGELLTGPTTEEAGAGFFTSINPGVKLQKLEVAGEEVVVDFDEILEQAVGGSCRVTAISAQITKTLLQFSNFKKVIISINGRTEDILQP